MTNKQLSIDASPIKALTLAHLNSQAVGRSKGGRRFVVESVAIDGKLNGMSHFTGNIVDL